jgi:hypothetical protein
VRGTKGQAVKRQAVKACVRVREQHCFRSVSILEGEAGALNLLAALGEKR